MLARWLQVAGLCAFGSLLVALSVDPFHQSWLALVAWAPLTAAALASARWRRGAADAGGASPDRRALLRLALVAWGVATLRWLWLESWIREVSEYGWPALAVVMGAFDALYAIVLARTEVGARFRGWPVAVRAGILLCGCEWFRGRVFMDGYPWFMPAQPLIDFPTLARAAEVIGAAGLGFLPGCVAGALAAAAVPPRAKWRGGVAVAAIALAAVLGYGLVAPSPADDGVLAVLVIQTNVPQSNKMAPTLQMQQDQFDGAMRTTLEAMRTLGERGRTPDLIAWPETVLPGVGLEADAIMLQRERGLWPADLLSSRLERFIDQSGVPMLVGSGAYEGLRVRGNQYEWNRHFNSGYLLKPGGRRERVDKVVLTPFGETMPYISRWKVLEQAMLDFGGRGMAFDLSVGDRPRTVALQRDGRRVALAVPICFEDTVSRAVRDLVNADDGADAIVNLSNDGWFGDFDPARGHHQQAARWRCVELRRSLLRVVNTGFSAAFDPRGRRVDGDALPPRTAGWMLAELPLNRSRTPFSVVGDVFSWAMFLLSFILTSLAGGMPARTARVAAAAAALLVGVLPVACSNSKQGKLPSWSSKDQSTTAEGDVSLSRRGVSKPSIPVSNSSDIARNARQVLDEASRNTDASLRAHAIEAMQHDISSFEPAMRRGLADRTASVRFVSAMCVAKVRMPGAAPLLEPLRLDPNDSVRAAAILALTRCGVEVDPSPLAAMIFSQSAELRGNAAIVLGELGNKSALILLHEAARLPMSQANPAAVRVVNLQIAEAMVLLGEESEIEPIHAALFYRSDQSECIELACEVVSRIGDKSSLPMLQRLIEAAGADQRPIDIRLFAAIAACKIMKAAPPGLVELAMNASRDPSTRVRALGAKLLGVAGGPEAESMLAKLLRDREPEVQVAAAGSILLRQSSAPTEAPPPEVAPAEPASKPAAEPNLELPR
jgi:apolipoprotein N-acyltransferase